MAAQSLAAQIMQFLKGTSSLLLGAIGREISLKLGSRPANHLCGTFELSGLLDGRRLAHETT